MVHVTLKSQNANIGYCIKMKILTDGWDYGGWWLCYRTKENTK